MYTLTSCCSVRSMIQTFHKLLPYSASSSSSSSLSLEAAMAWPRPRRSFLSTSQGKRSPRVLRTGNINRHKVVFLTNYLHHSDLTHVLVHGYPLCFRLLNRPRPGPLLKHQGDEASADVSVKHIVSITGTGRFLKISASRHPSPHLNYFWREGGRLWVWSSIAFCIDQNVFSRPRFCFTLTYSNVRTTSPQTKIQEPQNEYTFWKKGGKDKR